MIKSPFRYLLILLTLVLSIHTMDAQDKRKALEQKRQELRKEIQQINGLLNTNKKKKQSVLTKASDLDRKIKATEQLIRANNQEANLLTTEINDNQNRISSLRKELEKLKDDYAEMIKQSYKSRSKQSRIMFLFSSDDFLQAYKRLQYMKQYANYREQQGEKIKEQAEELQQLNKKLSEQREDKRNLLAANRTRQKKLEADKKEQESLIATINKKGSSYRRQIKKKQQKIKQIDAEIQKAIREAIAKENKKKGSTSKNSFKLTPEAKALAADFKANRGKLPWPIESGNVVVRFGKHPSPLVKSIPIQSNGIRIATNKEEPVHAIFDGRVLRIQAIKGANKAVYVQHGDYISIYNNLDKLNVRTGDIITTGQVLGRVGMSSTANRPILNFLIFKNMTALDPLHWILKR